MEPRARAGRHKSTLNFPEELKSLLYGAGAPVHPDALRSQQHPTSTSHLSHPPTTNTTHPPSPYARITPSTNQILSIEPLPETLRLLDELVTDFIIETCHAAYGVAWHSRRQKLKLSDFEWVMRRDRTKLGRVQEMFRKKRFIDDKRRLIEEGVGDKMQVSVMQDLGGVVGEEGTGRGKGRGRGRRKRKEREGDVTAGAVNGAGGGGAGDGDDEEDVPPVKRARSSVGED